MPITLYPPGNRANSAGTSHPWEWPEIADWLCSGGQQWPDKDSAPLWSPVLLEESPDSDRKSAQTAYFFACEYDHISRDQAEQVLTHIQYLDAVVYTTTSHTPDAPRLRIVVGTTRPIDRREWPSCMEFIGLGTGVMPAPESRHMSQAWYSPWGDAWIWRFGGELLDPDEAVRHCPPKPGRPWSEPLEEALIQTVSADERARTAHRELQHRHPPHLFHMACVCVRDCALAPRESVPIIYNYIREFRPDKIGKTRKEIYERCCNAQHYGHGDIGSALRPWRPFDDTGNALRLLDAHRHDLRYTRDIGRKGTWIHWASRGVWEEIDAPSWLFVDVMDELFARAQECAGENNDASAIRKWAGRCRNADKISSAVRLAGQHPACSIRAGDMDADPWLVGLGRAGTLDLRGTPTVRPNDPQDLITHVGVETEPEPAHRAPRFLQFVSEVFGGDEELSAYVQRFLGSCLVGVIPDHVMQFWYGNGRNGKSTMFRIVQHVLGSYACPMPEGLMTLRRAGDVHPAERATLRGKRFVVGSEAQRVRLNEGIVSQLVAGDPLRVRNMGQDFWTMQPCAKYVLSGSHKPVIVGHDDGIWDRIQLVPFTQQFRGSKKEEGLYDRLVAGEVPGILGWLVDGFSQWRDIGLSPPRVVLEASAKYRRESDVLLTFLKDTVVEGPSFTMPQTELWHLYRTWSVDSNEGTYVRKREFFEAMRKRYIEHRSGRPMFRGVKARR